MKGDLVGHLGDMAISNMIFIILYTILINKHYGVMLISQLPARSGPGQDNQSIGHSHSLSREQFPGRQL